MPVLFRGIPSKAITFEFEEWGVRFVARRNVTRSTRRDVSQPVGRSKIVDSNEVYSKISDASPFLMSSQLGKRRGISRWSILVDPPPRHLYRNQSKVHCSGVHLCQHNTTEGKGTRGSHRLAQSSPPLYNIPPFPSGLSLSPKHTYEELPCTCTPLSGMARKSQP